ncbi:MAG: hypothetical protein ACRD2D_02585, partial [Terriglobales bacterium]
MGWGQVVDGVDKPGGMSFRAAALALLTTALVVLALVNLRQLWIYRLPTDATLWRNTSAGLVAVEHKGEAGSPIRLGDQLLAIGGQPITSPDVVAQRLHDAGFGANLEYTVLRGQTLLNLSVPVEREKPPLRRYAYLELVGYLYLA